MERLRWGKGFRSCGLARRRVHGADAAEEQVGDDRREVGVAELPFG
jgi:hypothetical protein